MRSAILAMILFAGTVVLGAFIVINYSQSPPASFTTKTNPERNFDPPSSARRVDSSEDPMSTRRAQPRTPLAPAAAQPTGSTNKLERLAQIREKFHSLAAGDPAGALRSAKEISDATERETALLTLVTEWTHGELRSPSDRASAISLHGLEAGLGMELVNNPDLAILWANEVTEGAGRAALMQQTAIALTASDPSAAFALSEQLLDSERGKFFEEVFAGWAGIDTAAALDWANQLAAPVERDAALQAIRSAAPVGIGAALRMEDGYAVVNQIFPGTPAELSGQLHPGDRILALAQGDNTFVDAHGMSLKDIVDQIRGAPGSALRLQILPANAPPGSPAQTIAIVRDQIKFKR